MKRDIDYNVGVRVKAHLVDVDLTNIKIAIEEAVHSTSLPG